MVHSGFICKVKATGFFGGLSEEHQRKKISVQQKRGQMVEAKWEQTWRRSYGKASLLHPLINTIYIYEDCFGIRWTLPAFGNGIN